MHIMNENVLFSYYLRIINSELLITHQHIFYLSFMCLKYKNKTKLDLLLVLKGCF